MHYHVPEKLNADLSKPAVVHSNNLPWTPSQTPGVERRFLERDGGEVARASSIVRYAPGSAFPRHVHDKGEEYLVLNGVFSDEHGDFGKGAYVRNPPGSTHAPFTKDGCIIFVKLRQMPASTKDALVVRTLDMKGAPTSVAGVTRTTLFESETGETVAVETYAPGAQWLDRATHKGEEFLVLEGDLLYGDYVCEEGAWLRFPPGRALPIRSKTGCKVWVKRDHLAVQ
jgi:ChrR Cupin-like domain